ncbi:MAG: AMP-ligase, partial [Ilumatobacteraceae bacterium]
ASSDRGRHATGDVGHIDAEGRLWVGGRLGHVISTADGPVTPVRFEQAVETLAGVGAAAVVGVGPRGAQQMVVVVRTADVGRTPRAADAALTDRVRGVVDRPVASVFEVDRLPVDRRHNSKIDRTAVAAWAAAALAGGRLRSL